MPLVYGKTQHSAADDIQKELDFIIKRSESYKVAGVFYKFWVPRRSFPNEIIQPNSLVCWIHG